MGQHPVPGGEMEHAMIRTKKCARLVSLAFIVAVILGCATLSPDEQQAKRAELNAMGEKTIATLLDTRPEARDVLDTSIGYAVIDMTVTKIPMVGAGGGLGVVMDKRTDTRSYTKVSRFEVGGGLGAQKYKVIVFFSDEALLERAISGAWHFEAGAEAAAGDAAAEGQLKKKDERYRAFKIAESGAVATVTIRVARATPYLN